MKKTARLISLLLFVAFIATLNGCGPKKVEKKAGPLEVVHFNKAKALPDENITAMAAFGGQVWAGSKNGLFCYDSVNWKIHVKKNTNVLGSNLIESLKVSDGVLWIATDNGACRFDGNSWSSLYTGGRARSVSGKGSEVAIATAHGVEYSTGGGFQAYGKENAGLVFEEATAIGFDANGKLWVGTRAGMARLTSGVFQNFTGPQKSVMGSSLVDIPPSPSNCQLIGNNIKVIHPYNGMLAIGTTSGLCITDMEGTWRNYYATHKDWAQSAGKIIQQTVSGNSPLPGNNVLSLASSENDELLFVGTKKGLAILNGNSWIDTTVMLKDLPSTSIYGLAYLNGDLWVGTMNGVYQVKNVASLIKKAEK